MTTAMDTVAPATPPAPTLELCTDRATLAHALTMVGLAIARRPVVPLLGGVLLDGRDGHLTLTTTDYETVASVRIPDVVHAPGRLLIDHAEVTKLLAALVKGTRKRDADRLPVTVRTTGDATATLELGGYTMPVTTYAAEDFPTLPDTPPTVADADRDQLVSEARRVLVAAATDDRYPALTGAHLRITPGTVTMASTDRFRLAVASLAATTAADEDRSVLLPARVLSAALKHTSADRVRLGLSTGTAGEWVSLTCGDLSVITRPLEAVFPVYERLFPETAVTVKIDRAPLTQAVERAVAVLAAKKHTAQDNTGRRAGALVALACDPVGTVAVAPVLSEHTDAVTAPPHAGEINGLTEPLRVLFVASELRDALNTLNGDTATLQLDTPTRPLLLAGTDGDAYRHLLMPVRLPST